MMHSYFIPVVYIDSYKIWIHLQTFKKNNKKIWMHVHYFYVNNTIKYVETFTKYLQTFHQNFFTKSEYIKIYQK